MGNLDCLGVTLAGCEEISGKIIREHVRNAGRPEAGVIAGGLKTSIAQAAWVNGTKAHALDYDGNSTAVLAVGGESHSSGKDVLLACVTGFDIEARTAMVCAKQQYDLGSHTTSTLGSVAAVHKMLDSGDSKTRIASGIVGSLTGGLTKDLGTVLKPLYAGNTARNGVVAARC